MKSTATYRVFLMNFIELHSKQPLLLYSYCTYYLYVCLQNKSTSMLFIKYTNLVTKTKSAGTMALIITKTLTHVGLRGANYFYLQPHHAVIIRTGNTYTRSSSVSRVPPCVARDSMGAELFKNTVLY